MDYKGIAYQQKKAKNIGDFIEASKEINKNTIGDLLYEEIRKEIQTKHVELIEDIHKGKKNKEVLQKVIEEIIEKSEYGKGLSIAVLVKGIIDQILGWGKIQALIDEKNITNIFTNEKLQVIKRVAGRDYLTNITFDSDDELEQFIKNIMLRTGEKINRDKCVADTYDNLYNIRINAGIYGSPTRKEVVEKPYLTLRLYPANNFKEEDFINNGTFNHSILRFLKKYAINSTIAIAGQPDAGKTTILDFIESLVDPMRRTIKIQEEEELQARSSNSVSFVARKTNTEDARYKYDMAEFAKICTRQAGKRVIIGEVRDKEAWYLKRLIDMGYDALYTIHASDCMGALEQTAFLMSLANPQMSIKQMLRSITRSLKFVIYVEQRMIADIAEVVGFDEETEQPILNYIYKLDIDDGELIWREGELSEEFIKRKRIKDKLMERAV